MAVRQRIRVWRTWRGALLATGILWLFLPDSAVLGQGPKDAGKPAPARIQKRTYDFKDAGKEMEYALFVPAAYHKDRKTPLLVALHGLGATPQMMLRYPGFTSLAEKHGYIVVAPMGYNTKGWYGIRPPRPEKNQPANLSELSEKDVLNVLAIVRKEFNIDEKRIYLMGHSMGGGGTWHLGLKHPDLWAGLAPIAPAIFRRPTELEKIKHLPVILIQGDKDKLVPVAGARRWAEEMKKLGMTYDYVEVAGGGHVDVAFRNLPRIFEFFDKHQKPAEANQAGAKSILAPGARLERLADGFKFTEGPAADAQGNVYFTDQPNDRILKWSTDGKLSTFLQPCGRSNGLCFDNAGNLWACADAHNELWRIDPAKKVTVVVKDYQGKLLNGPNDVWVRPDGGLYFTDPFYKRDYWKRGPTEQDSEAVYYLAPDHKTLTRVADDLKQPNGIIGTPDGKVLYVADIRDNKTYAYDIQTDGTLKNKRLFCALGSDGMTIDNAGNVYLTGRGVTVFDKNGKQIDQIIVPEVWTANVCFGGKDRQTLFITASGGLYGLKMRVKGVGSQ